MIVCFNVIGSYNITMHITRERCIFNYCYYWVSGMASKS